uniref:Uncharacterized protein n=1 Tax=viral metagenome TaxID=1070528 RepID=A0A6M3LXR2_9ZZZZ
MARPKIDKITIRLSGSNIKILNSIRESGAFENDSQTVRFCIEFTNTILQNIPETIGESFVKAVIDEIDENEDK